MKSPVAELADLMRSIADGDASTIDRDLTVVTPPDDRSVGVLAFAGHNVVSTDVGEDLVRGWLPGDDLSAPLQAPFLTVLSAATDRLPDNLDAVLVAPATGRPNGMDLVEMVEFAEPLPPRLARALHQRIGVRAWTCPGGLLTLGRGVAGRWEVSIEVESALRGFGLGRGLFTAARGMLPFGETVWAQIAPGNAASMRAALAAGYRPVGAEVLLHPDRTAGWGSFAWFAELDEPVEPSTDAGTERAVEAAEAAQAVETVPPQTSAVGEWLETVDLGQPPSVSEEPVNKDESVDSN
jgi:hypothetical protein